MDEIKVGDKVRVVQIIVKEHGDRGFQASRVEYLRREGEVTNVTPPGFPRIIVLLPESGGVVAFNADELKVLSVPCEQRGFPEFSGVFWQHTANRTIERLRKSNERLVRGKRFLATELAELQNGHKQLRGEYDSVVRASAAMRVKIRNILNRGLDIPNNAD